MPLTLPSTGESGCSSKLRATNLLHALDLPAPEGLAALSGDSGALKSGSKLVSSIDTISPMTRRPEVFARVAVAHAFADIYASGGIPSDASISFGLDQAAVKTDDGAVLVRSVRKALSEADVRLCKAHTYMSPVVQITLSVVGRRDKLFRPMRQGSQYDLVLTKPIGAAAVCHDAWMLNDKSVIDSSERILQMDYRQVHQVLTDYCIAGTTDISGFGLLGHLVILSHAHNCEIEVRFSSLPFMRELDVAIAHAGGNCSARRNEEDFGDFCELTCHGSSLDRKKMYAAETSGPMLCVVKRDTTTKFIEILRQNGFEESCWIGVIKKGNVSRVKVS